MLNRAIHTWLDITWRNCGHSLALLNDDLAFDFIIILLHYAYSNLRANSVLFVKFNSRVQSRITRFKIILICESWKTFASNVQNYKFLSNAWWRKGNYVLILFSIQTSASTTDASLVSHRRCLNLHYKCVSLKFHLSRLHHIGVDLFSWLGIWSVSSAREQSDRGGGGWEGRYPLPTVGTLKQIRVSNRMLEPVKNDF